MAEEVKQAAEAQADQPQETTAAAEAPVTETTETTQAPVVEETGTQAEPAPAVKAPEPVVAPKAQQNQKQQPKQQVVQKPAQQAAQAPVREQTFEELIEELKIIGTPQQQNIIAFFENYIAAMQPGKPVDPDAGARNQFSFWVGLRTVINNSTNEEFKSLWSLVLAYFKNYEKTVFHDRYVFRFSEFWIQSEVELTAFQRMLNLIKLTADPQTRAHGLKQVDLDRTLTEALNDEGRSRILSFYGK